MSLTKAHNRMIEGSPVNVRDYGAVGDGVTDDTSAIQAACNAAGSSSILIPSGDYLLTAQISCSSFLQGDGLGRTRLIFDMSGGATNGLYFTWDTEYEELGVADCSVLCKNANGLTAISCEKSVYFTETNKLRVSNVQVADFGGPQEAVAGFLTVYTWATGIDSGDVQGLTLTNVSIYSNYDITATDGSNDVSVGIKLDGTDTQLFTRLDAIWINACRTGISLEDNSFGHIDNADITRSWIGFDASTTSNFNEIFLSNVVVNAQKIGFNIDGLTRLFISNSFVNRHADGLDQGHIWYGYLLDAVTKSFISNAHAQPNMAATPDQVGFRFIDCGDVQVPSITPASGLDVGVEINNSSNIVGSVAYGDTTGTIIDLANNARVINLRVGVSESFGGTWYSEDGSLDLRNIELDLVDATEYGLTSPSKFIEKLAVIDKDNLGGTDEGFAFVCENGDLRVKSITSGSEANVILLDRTGSTINEMDFRTTKVTLNNGPNWHSGTGSPEGVVTANVGSFYSRTDGGTGTSFYIKETGTGNTGWVAK